MKKDEAPREITIFDRGTVTEKRIQDGQYWYEYKVESITRKGLVTRWIQSVDAIEHVNIPGTWENSGYAVGTKVMFFLYGDGHGAIIDRMEPTKADYDSKIGKLVEMMAGVTEKLAEIEAEISGAKDEIKGAVTSAQSAIESAITGAKGELNTAIGNAKDEIKGAVTGAQSAIENAVNGAKGEINTAISNAKGELDGKLTAMKTVEDEIHAAVCE